MVQTPMQRLGGEEMVEVLLEALVAEVQQAVHKAQEVLEIVEPMVV